VFDALIAEARRTGPDQWITHEDLGRRLAFTEEEHAAARARIQRRQQEDEAAGEAEQPTVAAKDAPLELRRLVAATAGTGVLALLTFRMYRNLVEKLGSDLAAQQCLLDIATEVGRPVAVNVPAKRGSQTWFIPPRGWTDEELQGFVAGQ